MASQAVPQRDVYNILWTGGWDSTFRLLQILTDDQDAIVQPHYLVDAKRPTANVEMTTMRDITNAWEQKAEIPARIRQPIFVIVQDVPRDEHIDASWQAIREDVPIGVQYRWLAEYAKSIPNDTCLEIGIEKGGRIHGILASRLVEKPGRTGQTYVLEPSSRNGKYHLFSFFEFPIIDKTKIDMMTYANTHMFDELMDKTWFCFFPIAGRYPCGFCNPCISTFRKGMKHRIGWRGLFLGVPAGLMYRKLPKNLQTSLKHFGRHTQSQRSGTP